MYFVLPQLFAGDLWGCPSCPVQPQGAPAFVRKFQFSLGNQTVLLVRWLHGPNCPWYFVMQNDRAGQAGSQLWALSSACVLDLGAVSIQTISLSRPSTCSSVVHDYRSHWVKDWVTSHYFLHCDALMQINPLKSAPETVRHRGCVNEAKLWSEIWRWSGLLTLSYVFFTKSPSLSSSVNWQKNSNALVEVL